MDGAAANGALPDRLRIVGQASTQCHRHAYRDYPLSTAWQLWQTATVVDSVRKEVLTSPPVTCDW